MLYGATGTAALKFAEPFLISRAAGDQGDYQENQSEECKCTTGNHQKDLPNRDADHQQHNTEHERSDPSPSTANNNTRYDEVTSFIV